MRAPQPRPIAMDRDRGEVLGSGEFVQQSLRRVQIGRPESFGEASIHRRQENSRLPNAPVVVLQSGDAHSGAKFPAIELSPNFGDGLKDQAAAWA